MTFMKQEWCITLKVSTLKLASKSFVMLYLMKTFTFKNQVQDLVHFGSIGVEVGLLKYKFKPKRYLYWKYDMYLLLLCFFLKLKNFKFVEEC